MDIFKWFGGLMSSKPQYHTVITDPTNTEVSDSTVTSSGVSPGATLQAAAQQNVFGSSGSALSWTSGSAGSLAPYYRTLGAYAARGFNDSFEIMFDNKDNWTVSQLMGIGYQLVNKETRQVKVLVLSKSTAEPEYTDMLTHEEYLVKVKPTPVEAQGYIQSVTYQIFSKKQLEVREEIDELLK